MFSDLGKAISLLPKREVVFPQSELVDQLSFHHPNTKKSETIFFQTNGH